MFGCNEIEEDSNKATNVKQNGIVIKTLSLKQVIENQAVFKKLTEPKVKIKNQLEVQGKIIHDTINNFSVNTEQARYIEIGNYHSYTFKVTRLNGSNYSLENLVISKLANNQYETYLYQYNLTSIELEKIKNLQYVNLINKANKVKLENSNVASNMQGKYYFNGKCYEDSQVFVAGHNCQSGQHSIYDGEQCIYFGGSGSATLGMNVTQTSEVACDDGGDSGYSGAGDGPVLGSDSSDGGSPSSITTTPVTENLEPFSNICDELAKKDAVQAFKDKLYTELKNKAATQDFESAYMLYNNAVEGLTFSNEFVGDPNDRQGGQVNIDIGGLPTQSTVNCVGFIHCHLNNGATYKVFSIGDLIALAQIATMSTNSGKEFAIYVITSSGTFAITVNDKLLLKSKLETLKDNQSIYEDYFDMKVKKTETVDLQVKGFLDFMRTNSDLGGLGINLNKKNEATGKWEQLTLSSNRIDVLTNSCN